MSEPQRTTTSIGTPGYQVRRRIEEKANTAPYQQTTRKLEVHPPDREAVLRLIKFLKSYDPEIL